MFFGQVQEPLVQAVPTEEIVRPKYAVRIIGAGIALVVASILAMIFRHQLPPHVPGFYLAIGGAAVVAAGALYFYLGTDRIIPPLPQAVKAADSALKIIDEQIRNFQSCAELEADQANSRLGIEGGGYRAHIVGIGSKAWNDGHDIAVRELDGNRMLASVVHLVAVDLSPPFLSIRQMGLDLMTGTVREDARSRQLIVDIHTVAHQIKRTVATSEWEKADAITTELAQIEKKIFKAGDKMASRVEQLKRELDKLSFDDHSGDKFLLTFANGEQVAITVADSAYARNPREIAHPVLGPANLTAAVEAWARIADASVMAKAERLRQRREQTASAAAMKDAVVGVKSGLERDNSQVLASLEAMKERMAALERLASGTMAAASAQPTQPRPTAAAPALANGHDATMQSLPAQASAAVASPPPETQPAKSGA
jgi:hypothetical protein